MASDKDTIIKVTNAAVRFNMASERIDNLKEYFVKLIKRELMFQEFMALKDINFEVKRGEAWGLIGTNGSGKSTLLKLICGILKPYRGTVEVRGSIAPLIELGAGFDGELTATENIYLNGAVLGYSKEFMDAHYDEIVEFAELKDFMNMPIKNYSSGMKSKLGFAIATIAEPEILILDEVLSVGDGKFRKKSEKKILDMMQDGTAVLFVSHSLAQVKRICNKAMILEGGKMIAFGDVDEVAQVYAEMTGELDELTVGQKNLVKKKNKKKKTEKIKQEDKREVMEES